MLQVISMSILLFSIAAVSVSADNLNVDMSGDGSVGAEVLEVLNSGAGFEPPKSGFVKGTIKGDIYEEMTFQFKKEINQPALCHAIKLENPGFRNSPFVGNDVFILNMDLRNSVNGHYTWFNGVEHLSLLKGEDGDIGTWIIGVEPGVDNGFVHIRTNRVGALSPLNLEHTSIKAPEQSVHWYWLNDNMWERQQDLLARCVDAHPPAPRYYEIAYFDTGFDSSDLISSYFVEDLNTNIITQTQSSLESESDSPTDTHTPTPAFYDPLRGQWRAVDLGSLATIVTFGEPCAVTFEESSQSSRTPTIATLVNEEHAGKGWRLTMHTAPAHGHSLIKEAGGSELVLELDNAGVRHTAEGGVRAVAPLTKAEEAKSLRAMTSTLAGTTQLYPLLSTLYLLGAYSYSYPYSYWSLSLSLSLSLFLFLPLSLPTPLPPYRCKGGRLDLALV